MRRWCLMVPAAAVAFAAAVFFIPACHNADDGGDPVGPADYPESCPDGPLFSFDLSATPMVVPFPNDLYAVEDPGSPTGRRVHIDGETARPLGELAAVPAIGFVTDAYNELTGFSTLADLYLPVGAGPTRSNIPDKIAPGLGDGLFLMVDDDGSPWDGSFAPLVTAWRAPHLHLTPWFPLKERTRYVLVATRTLRPPGGCYRASPSMRTVWAARANGETSGPGGRYTSILDRLARLGLPPEQVLSIADFTTGWITRDLEAARLVLEELADAAPSHFYDWEIDPHSDPRLWATAHATLDVPIFKPGGHAWTFDAEGRPVVDHFEPVKAYFTLPASDAGPYGPPHPILVFGHGLFNRKEEIRPPFTTEAAAQGFATVSIDAVCHGDRMPPGGELGRFFCFFDFFHMPAWRDTWRESVANTSWLVRSLETLEGLDLDGDGAADFDTGRVYYLGSSLGTILGGTFAALEPLIDAHVMVASGAKITSIALDGPVAPLFDLIELFEGISRPDRPVTDFLQVSLGMFQAIFDPADPANYLVHLNDDPLPVMDGHAPQVFQQASAFDESLGGVSGGWFCRAGGWPQMVPFAWDAGVPHVSAPYLGSAFCQYDTSDHTILFSHDPLGKALRAQVFHFLRTHLETGVGEIIDPLG